MKVKLLSNRVNSILIFIAIIVFSTEILSCNFNFTDIPGPQISSSIKDSKNHRVFLATYGVDGNNINDIQIESIFLERKYSLDEGLFSNFHINNSKFQLVIVSNGFIPTEYADDKLKWKLTEFHDKSSNVIYKNIDGPIVPHSILITISSSITNHKQLKKLTLNQLN